MQIHILREQNLNKITFYPLNAVTRTYFIPFFIKRFSFIHLCLVCPLFSCLQLA